MEKTAAFESRSVSSHDLEIAQARDYYIVQRNDLVQKQRFKIEKEKNAGSLSVAEEKLFAYIISQIKPGTETLPLIPFDVKTFCEVAGLTKGTNEVCYHFVKATLTKLLGRVLWLYDKETGVEVNAYYVLRAFLKPGEGSGKLQLDELLGPYLLNLAGNYFQFSYHNILAMKSKYGIQLYKLLKSYAFNYPRIKFSLEDLKEHLDAASYANFANFKKKVMAPALKDINTYSDLDVTVEYEKTGRAFTHVIFTMKSLEKPRTPEEAEEAQRRYSNVEREIDPDQLTIEEYLGGLLL